MMDTKTKNNNNNKGYKNFNSAGIVKVTRNIRAISVVKKKKPVRLPKTGVLYQYDITGWQDQTAFYSCIELSFGIPSTQKVVFCNYLRCKVLHYERTCQGVYYCPYEDMCKEKNQPYGDDEVKDCTVKPCRFRFHTCDKHKLQLKKSCPCKYKLHFYVPLDQKDTRRLVLCLGNHTHKEISPVKNDIFDDNEDEEELDVYQDDSYSPSVKSEQPKDSKSEEGPSRMMQLAELIKQTPQLLPNNPPPSTVTIQPKTEVVKNSPNDQQLPPIKKDNPNTMFSYYTLGNQLTNSNHSSTFPPLSYSFHPQNQLPTQYLHPTQYYYQSQYIRPIVTPLPSTPQNYLHPQSVPFQYSTYSNQIVSPPPSTFVQIPPFHSQKEQSIQSKVEPIIRPTLYSGAASLNTNSSSAFRKYASSKTPSTTSSHMYSPYSKQFPTIIPSKPSPLRIRPPSPKKENDRNTENNDAFNGLVALASLSSSLLQSSHQQNLETSNFPKAESNTVFNRLPSIHDLLPFKPE